MLDLLGAAILAAEEKRPKLLADETRVGNAGHLDVILDLGPWDAAGCILHNDDVELPTEQELQHFLDVRESLDLPSLPDQVRRDRLQTMDNEAIHELLVGVVIRQLCVGGRLPLHDGIQTTMVLLKDHDTVLKNTGGLTRLDENLLWRSLELFDQILSRIEKVQDVLKT